MSATLRKIALDAARVARRKAWDTPDPTTEELDQHLEPEECIEIVRSMVDEMDSADRQAFLDQLIELATPESELGVDRARRGVPGAARARGAGDRHRLAGDQALPRGVLPASERFKNLGRFSSLG